VREASPGGDRARIHLHIERLVLEGLDLPPGGSRAVADAVREEIARLVGERGLGPDVEAGGAAPSAPARPVGATSDPVALGTAVGRSVHGALHGGPGGGPGGRPDGGPGGRRAR
jgi:hypothetical protein